MALSNWDTLAFNKDSVASHGTVVSTLNEKRQVRIYKNWVYLDDPDAWTEDIGYVEPVVGEIRSGEIYYKDFKIYAGRTELQQAVFLFATSSNYNVEPVDKNWGGGIGCYGFEDDGRFIGVTPELFNKWQEWVTEVVARICYWFNDGQIREWVAKCAAEPKRYNQGDAYLTAKAGLPNETPVTAIGEAEDPLMIKLIKTGKEDD